MPPARVQIEDIAPELWARVMAVILGGPADAGGAITGRRFVAAKRDSAPAIADAIAASGAPARPCWKPGLVGRRLDAREDM